MLLFSTLWGRFRVRNILLTIPFVIGLALAGIAEAEPVSIQRSDALVSFNYSIAGQNARGTIPLVDANIDFDIDNLASMRIDAVFAADNANAGIAPLTAAMQGPELLDTKRFSTIRYNSTGARGTAEKLEVLGEVTIRDVTRPLTLQVTISPIEVGDGLRKYSIRMTGAIDRNAFGASGYPAILGDVIGLSIIARINAGDS